LKLHYLIIYFYEGLKAENLCQSAHKYSFYSYFYTAFSGRIAIYAQKSIASC